MARALPTVTPPESEEQRAKHCLTHLPHAQWCDICVPARAADAAHWTRTEKREEEIDPAAPILIEMDYIFGSDVADMG